MREVHFVNTNTNLTEEQRQGAEDLAKAFAKGELPHEVLVFMVRTMVFSAALTKFKQVLSSTPEKLKSLCYFSEVRVAGESLLRATQDVITACDDAEKAMKILDETGKKNGAAHA